MGFESVGQLSADLHPTDCTFIYLYGDELCDKMQSPCRVSFVASDICACVGVCVWGGGGGADVCQTVRIAGLTARPRVSGILERKAVCKTEEIEVFARGVCVSACELIE